jgi:hypothetical protein
VQLAQILKEIIIKMNTENEQIINKRVVDCKELTKRFRISEEEFKIIDEYVLNHKHKVKNLSDLCRKAIFEYIENHD